MIFLIITFVSAFLTQTSKLHCVFHPAEVTHHWLQVCY